MLAGMRYPDIHQMKHTRLPRIPYPAFLSEGRFDVIMSATSSLSCSQVRLHFPKSRTSQSMG